MIFANSEIHETPDVLPIQAGTNSAAPLSLKPSTSNSTLLADKANNRQALTERTRRIIIGSLLPLIAIILWESVELSGIVSAALIPGPLAVLRAIEAWAGFGSSGGNLFFSGRLISDVFATLLRVFVGFLLASLLGVIVGTGIGMSRLVDEVVTPTIRILGPVPPITWIPVAIVVLGIGEVTNFFLTFLGALFPIVAGTAIAVSGVDRNLLRVGRMMGRRGLTLVRSVVLPASWPNIVGALRMGLSISWLMAVTSEMLAVHSGLGYTLWNAYNYLDYSAVFAAMFMIGLCGLTTDVLLRSLTKKTLTWHVETGVRS